MPYNDIVNPTHVTYGGHVLPLIPLHGGGHVVFDPLNYIPGDHFHWHRFNQPFQPPIPPGGYRNPVFGPGDSGPFSGEMGALTQTEQQGFHAAAAAASFIPYAGPFISAAIEIAGGLLGQGDPTPIGKLWEAIISLRVQAANLRDSLAAVGIGQSDPFTIDPNIDPDDPNTGGVVSAQITNEVLNQFPADQNSPKLRYEIKRGMEYEAIAALQKQVASLQHQYDQVMTAQEIKAGIAAGLANAGIGQQSAAGDYGGSYTDYYPYQPGIQDSQGRTIPPPPPPSGQAPTPPAPGFNVAGFLTSPIAVIVGGGALLALLLKRK